MYEKIVKRILDIFFSFLILIIAFIPMLIIFLIIYIEIKESPLFVQRRTGKNGVIFNIYKMKSMRDNGEITATGKFVRRFSLDELPQLLNILRGEMSFIGPRPWIPDYYALFNENQKKRTLVKPGLSGWAQVKGRNNLSVFDKINYDLWYVDNISFLTDLKIVFMTITSVFSSKDGVNASADDIQSELEALKNQGNDLDLVAESKSESKSKITVTV
jgi:lipopolysaccharide/colanic/teichoic acid biosynthesis glycosyltransferase